jgi:hypothetical protein
MANGRCADRRGYGQTIYAIIRSRWDLPAEGRLRLSFFESPPYQRFAGFKPSGADPVKEAGYRLDAREVAG